MSFQASQQTAVLSGKGRFKSSVASPPRSGDGAFKSSVVVLGEPGQETTRKNWDADELMEIDQYFADEFCRKTLLSKESCIKAIEASKNAGGKLWKRMSDYTMIKKMISYINLEGGAKRHRKDGGKKPK